MKGVINSTLRFNGVSKERGRKSSAAGQTGNPEGELLDESLSPSSF
ncbi:hypothetical protein [Candidatus Aquicultor secundus]|nr:hypothetical protein [Candidatus Aquicultor secundus]